MKNPRRTRDADGQEIAPATVGSKRADSIRAVEIWCGECQHHAEISTDGMPANLAFPDICLRYRCSACGSRNLTSRPSVMAHYAALQILTGLNHGSVPAAQSVVPDDAEGTNQAAGSHRATSGLP